MEGKVITVRGLIDPGNVGMTVMHEHLVCDLSCLFVEPEEATLRALRTAPVTMSMLGTLHRRPISTTMDNMILGDEEVAIEEALQFVREGGSTIVDVTNIGMSRDPRALLRISNATKLNVVMGTGCYLELAHPPWVTAANVDELRDHFVKEITVGVDGTGIRAGIIGEIGTTGVSKSAAGTGYGLDSKVGDITPEEEKVLRAAGQAARATGAAVSVHVDPMGHGALEVIGILEDEGLEPSRMVMGHLDQVDDYDYHREIARRGAVLEYDSLGRHSYLEEQGRSFGHDTWRIEFLARLCEAGFEDQLVLSQDCCFKMDLKAYGGNGYGHVLRNVVPMMRKRGIRETSIQKMLVDNPTRILTLSTPDSQFA